jgi:hypothetical protein
VESESTPAAAAPPEQELTEALLALSWPLPRTVEDADAAISRLEEVRSVLTRLEQQSVGSEAWWAGQVDGLATQSGFVLEWWRPVLRDPDLDWTLNHQAHLTADLATLASAGARLLDQIEPRAAEEAAEAAHARRVAREKRWGPAAVPPFVPTGPRPGAPGARPQPPAEVFGDAVPPAAAAALVDAPAENARPVQRPQAAAPAPPVQPMVAPAPPAQPTVAPAAASEPGDESKAFNPFEALLFASAANLPSAAPSEPSSEPAAPPIAAPPSAPAQGPYTPIPGMERPPAAEPISDEPAQAAAIRPYAPGPAPVPPPAPVPAPAPENPLAAARHRRPAYDFDDANGSAPPPAAFPQGARPPRSPIVPGPGFGGPPHQGRTLAPGDPYRAAEHGVGAFGFVGEEDDDEPDSLVPTGLRRHQRRLLVQTGVVLGAIGVLCWWAVYAVSSPSTHHTAAADPTSHATGTSTGRTVAAGGLGAPRSASGKPSASAPADAAPPTTTDSGPDATTVSSVRVTLLGGSAAVPQIAVLITVDTAGTGQVTVTGSYYGASGSSKVAAETEQWALSGKTSYQYSVPIANSDYCGTQFHFTASAGGRSDAGETAPGC